MANIWTREEEIIVFNLYCKIPFQKSSKNHPEVVKIARIIGRSPSAVNMKIGNFGSFDEYLKRQGIVGLTNASKLDGEIFREFHNNWEELAYQSEMLIQKYLRNGSFDEDFEEDNCIPIGYEKTITIKQRVNQHFFRSAVLASYGNACCITGLSNGKLLIASHIKPWKNSDENEKTNPQNGLCLNSLHDRAFDMGLITIKPDFSIVISDSLTDIFDGESVRTYFGRYKHQKIRLPDKFIPEKSFLEYHNDMIFEGWK